MGNGYQDGEDTEGEDELVYITELGTVWHRSATCPYLQLSIQYVPYTGLGNMRNESGGRYHACERCVIGTTMTGIYITQYGDRYHNSLNTVRYAERIYYDKKRDWNKIVERAMSQDFSWQNSARQYEELYKSLIGE